MEKKLRIVLPAILLFLISAVGLILAFVGLFVPWFALEGKTVIGNEAQEYCLFTKSLLDGDFPLACVQAFALLALIFSVLGVIANVLRQFEVLKLGPAVGLICGSVVALLGVLAFVFALVFNGCYKSVSYGNLGSVELAMRAGAFLLPFGTLLTSLPLFFWKK